MNYNVTVIPGDGIGPEIVREARKVLDQVGKVFGHSFDYTEILMGGCSIDAYGCLLYTSIGILRDGMFVFEGTVKEAVDISPYSNLEDAYLWWTQEEENR